VSDVGLQCDWIAVRKCIFPEPSASLGFEILSSEKIWVGDVTFSNTTIVENTTIILAGNLTIQSGGNLTLRNVSLWMDCHAVGQYHIKVVNGGTLSIEGNSTVTAVNPSFAWFLMAKPNTNLRLLDSHFSYGGWEWGSYGNHTGIWINTNEAQVINCTMNYCYDGIYLYEANDSIIANNTITNVNSVGIYFQNAANSTVSHNTIINSSFFGICLGGTSPPPTLGARNSTVSDNIIINTVADAISINESPNCTVSRNYVEESGGYGIRFSESGNSTINSNFIIDAAAGYAGIGLSRSDNSTASNNIIANSSSYGISLNRNSHCNITRNTISGSGSYGIYIPAFASSGNCIFWGNALGSNILGPSNQNNAWDTNGTNSWDNGSYGNWWDNYTGVDETPPDGFGDSAHPVQGGAGAQDNFPLMEAPDYIPPIVDHPADITYEAGTTGHNITWHPRDDNPDSHVIYQEGTALNWSVWSGGDISQEIDGLVVGTYNFTLMVNDTVGHVTSDTVWVTVVDTTPPILNIASPTNRTYTFPTITVTLSGGANHYWYYIDGVDTTNQSWTSSEARTLENGMYTLHAYANDSFGNEASSQVTFTINYPGPTVIISSPTNTTYATATITVTLSGNAIHYWYSTEGVDATNQSWTDSQTRTLDDGVYTLYAYGNDSIGKETRISVVFTIALPGPTVLISSPRNTTTYAIGTITVTLSGNATHYWYYIHGVDTTNQSWTGSDSRTLGNGVYTLYAYGNDSVGRETRTWVVFTIEIDPTVIAEIYDEISGTENLFLVSDGIAVSVDVSSPVSISIKQVSSAPETPSSLDPLGIYLDITVSNSSAFMGMWINVSFAELGDQDPTSVRIYFYNETSQEWERPKQTGVDDENEVVWAWTDHLTIFGLCERIEPDEEDDLLLIIVLVVGGLTLILGVLAVVFYRRAQELQTRERRKRSEDWTRDW
jgi:parallel beta-helix repeat protein